METSADVSEIDPAVSPETTAPQEKRSQVVEEVESPGLQKSGTGPVEEMVTSSSSEPTSASDETTQRQLPIPQWLDSLRPTDSKINKAALEDSQASESTGVMTGLTTLFPPEKLPTAAPTPAETQPDALLRAAREFHAIATQPPTSAAFPAVLTEPMQLVGNIPRAVLYLLFIVLVALPLLPGLRAADTGRETPWTEPGEQFSEELGKQRRLLVSEELGIIDLQQPGAVAIVSIDYSAATAGEMQPIAEAIVGRLAGQNMRIIFVSLEPEGAALAQQTIDKFLTQRKEAYGLKMVNLGYLPGRVAAIRKLVTDATALSSIEDFKEELTFSSSERAEWRELNNLDQVDLVVTITDNPVTARWWVEQMELAAQPEAAERLLLAAASATAGPLVQPYRDSGQLDGLIVGINGAAAIEAGRKEQGPARQMLDSQSIAHLLIVILIAAGTIVGWMPAIHAGELTSDGSDYEPTNSEEGGPQ